MHSMIGWPAFNALAVAALTTTALVDARSRTIVNWLLLPALAGGAVVLLYLSKMA